MFLRLPEKLIKRINFRLALLFSLIFIVSFLFLFGVTYFLLSGSLKREDRETLRLKLLTLSAEYRIGGIERLQREITLEKLFGERAISLVRVADRSNATLFLLAPAYWREADIEILNQKTTSTNEDLIRVQLNEDILEIVSLTLPDSNQLQIGISIKDREKTLQRFIEIIIPFTITVVVMSFFGGMLFSSRMLQPISNLTSTVQSIINTGMIKARIPTRQIGDELDRLVTLFNRMLEKIEVLVNGMRGALDTVAHDLRTPMTRFRGIAERALQSPKNGELYDEALVSCVEESERILTMLNTLMDISEAETGALKLNLKKVKISQIIEDIADLYSYIAEEKNISLTTEVSESTAVTDIFIFVDVHRIKQVIANLVDNAIKYTPPGGSIKVKAFTVDNYMCITVEDTGMGIQKDEMQHIWDRLYRGTQSMSIQGLGLGLSLVKAIVQAHGGRIELSSAPRRGSRFSVYIPIKR